MSIILEYELYTDALGWAKCKVEIEGQSLKMDWISYLTDALGDLVKNFNSLLKGEKKTHIFFSGEPYGYSWILEKFNDDGMNIKIYRNSWDDSVVYEDKCLLKAQCSLMDFGQALSKCLEKVLATYGMDEYTKIWGDYGFPVTDSIELQQLLKSFNTNS